MSETLREAIVHHGGNLNAARALFPDAPLPWVDLSTGLNPRSWPGPQGLPALAHDIFARLPEPAALAALEAVAAHAYGVADAGCVVAAAGAQALIQHLPIVRPAQRVAIARATYQGHGRAWAAAGATMVAADADDCDVAVIVNPNNPDGSLTPAADIAARAAALARNGALLIVDESFADFAAPGVSLAPLMPMDGVIVLRSFGKAYGLAGVRLGFAIAARPLAMRLRKLIGPWPVNGPAIALGAAALADATWHEAAALRLAKDGLRLDALLTAAGCTLAGGTALFRLVTHARADALFDRLGRSGILVRPFAEQPAWLRFGLPAEGDWGRLEAALEDFRTQA